MVPVDIPTPIRLPIQHMDAVDADGTIGVKQTDKHGNGIPVLDICPDVSGETGCRHCFTIRTRHCLHRLMFCDFSADDHIHLIALFATGKDISLFPAFGKMRACQAFRRKVLTHLVRFMRDSHMHSGMPSLPPRLPSCFLPLAAGLRFVEAIL